MVSKLVRNASIIFLISTSFCYARQNDEVNCPSVYTIQQNNGKIDTAHVYGNDNVASASTYFYDNNFNWLLSARHLNGKSKQEVISNGKQAVKSVNVGQAKTDSQSAHICYYKPGYVYATGIETTN